jgi:hypothetical protein
MLFESNNLKNSLNSSCGGRLATTNPAQPFECLKPLFDRRDSQYPTASKSSVSSSGTALMILVYRRNNLRGDVFAGAAQGIS